MSRCIDLRHQNGMPGATGGPLGAILTTFVSFLVRVLIYFPLLFFYTCARHSASSMLRELLAPLGKLAAPTTSAPHPRNATCHATPRNATNATQHATRNSTQRNVTFLSPYCTPLCFQPAALAPGACRLACCSVAGLGASACEITPPSLSQRPILRHI